MAKRLTEEMVIARTKISDLSKIKRLNCWGSELVDISLLRKMPCVEVLSLSINKIRNLSDFQFCKRLEELYIRQNDIKDLNEVVYLQNLPNLKNLWLGENPCANIEGYRLSVIKTLPQLQKLDNVQITPEEIKEAQRRGRTLQHPDDVQTSPEEEEEVEDEEVYIPAPQQHTTGGSSNNRYQQQAHEYSESEYSPIQRSPPRTEPEYDPEESEDCYPREEVSEECKEYSPPRQHSPPRRAEPAPPPRRSYSPAEPVYVERRRNSYERESPKQSAQYYERCPADNPYEDNTICDNTYREAKLVNSQSASCIKEYANGDRYVHPAQSYRQQQLAEASSDISSSIHGGGGGHDSRRGGGGVESRYASSCAATHGRVPFARRPVTRNSNILSAVLRLVKELDYPSLEVVEMEVRSRMDELLDE